MKHFGVFTQFLVIYNSLFCKADHLYQPRALLSMVLDRTSFTELELVSVVSTHLHTQG